MIKVFISIGAFVTLLAINSEIMAQPKSGQVGETFEGVRSVDI